MNRKAILGILVTQILFTGLLGMINMPTLAETIPITEVFYGDGHQLFEQGIYIIATETDPVEMYPNYTNKKAYYEMLKEHVTTETSVGLFVSILVSQGICPSSGYGVGIESIEKIDNEFVISANLTEPGPGCIVLLIINNPVALIPIGSLPVGEYSISLQVDQYVYHCPSWWYQHIGTETWTATFSCSEWITVTSSAVEMSIENKTTTLGKELTILMVAPIGAFMLPSSQVFDVYLFDSNYSLFSYWSHDKSFWDVMTSVPPGYTETLEWNLYHYDPSIGEFTPPPPGDYYIIGAIMASASGPADFTPPILIRINESTITPIAVAVSPETLPPTAQFIYSPTFPYVGQAVTFDASGSSDPDGTIVSYEWDFGDGSTGTDVLTSYTYGSAGTFNVTLTVTDDLGATDTLQQEITVDPLPTLTITINKIKKGTTETILLELMDDDYDGFITQDIHNRILSIIKHTHKTTTFDFPGTYSATKGALKVTLQSRNDFTITLAK